MANWRQVSRNPALPTMYPTLRNNKEENMERVTGAKTPLMVPNVLVLESSVSGDPARDRNKFLSPFTS